MYTYTHSQLHLVCIVRDPKKLKKIDLAVSTATVSGILGFWLYVNLCIHINVCIHLLFVQPISFGVSFDLNLQSQSHWSLSNTTWQKRPRELDHRLRFQNEKRTPQI